MKHSLTHSHTDTPDNKLNHLLTHSQRIRTRVRGLYESLKRNTTIGKCSEMYGSILRLFVARCVEIANLRNNQEFHDDMMTLLCRMEGTLTHTRRTYVCEE